MALFIRNLAYPPETNIYNQTDKLAILLGSLLSGVVGYTVARVFGNKIRKKKAPKTHNIASFNLF